ncbi:hypothetical protein [Bradyrhizobium commune]|uniref:Uncharacterized protein n=1 Tax=Bradyrhizobium commune TaxID=83627 RepID=A0A7S9H3V4_9BRAD|nr:hypothetical protein [Bradyrhizobium commune]QPF95446.1 hypothetical protein IC761_10875 [Bradyrhizobium commune]
MSDFGGCIVHEMDVDLATAAHEPPFKNRATKRLRSGHADHGRHGLQQAPTAKIGLLANASLRVEPCTTPYQVMPHP